MIVSIKASRLAVAGFLALITAIVATESKAQESLRNTFPGRRVGGGTRGECNTRIVIHLVNADNRFSPEKILAVIEGPTTKPTPLQMKIKDTKGGDVIWEKTLPPSRAGLTIVQTIEPKNKALWESSYDCSSGSQDWDTQEALGFVQSSSPPALTLILNKRRAKDQSTRTLIQKLYQSCGGVVESKTLMESQELGDLINTKWPEKLPIRCP